MFTNDHFNKKYLKVSPTGGDLEGAVYEKKHPPICIFWFVALDSMAAYAAYYFFPFRGVCADADGDGKYHPVGIGT